MRKITTSEWINRAVNAHGDKYDYSSVNYVNGDTKVKIKCPNHGEFMQRPASHCRGIGCPKCGGTGKMTKVDFLKKAKEVHGERYDYSDAVYTNSKTKIKIRCRQHGIYEQKPNNHLNGQGCIHCAGVGRLSLSEFISRSKKAHGEKYDYSKANYRGNKVKVKIVCPKHGDFFQVPASHMAGRGCDKCGGTSKISNDEFIRISTNAHGRKYDYSNTSYTNQMHKVEITCSEHGPFLQWPGDHINGSGCPKCMGGASIDKESFIKCAESIHGGKYDYTEVVYVSSKTKVDIICKKHGKFSQIPNGHLQGQGCPRCPNRYEEPTRIYIMHNSEQVKIGYAIEPERRLSQINVDSPFTVELLHVWTLPDTPAARQVESEIHKELAHLNAGLTGFDGATEWFNTTPAHAAEVVARVVKKYE